MLNDATIFSNQVLFLRINLHACKIAINPKPEVNGKGSLINVHCHFFLGLTLQMIPLSMRSCLGVLEYPRAVGIVINVKR